MAYVPVNPYCQLEDVKEVLRISDSHDDTRILMAIESASRKIETACSRRFWQDVDVREDPGCTFISGSNVVLDPNITALDINSSVFDPTSNEIVQPNAVCGNIIPGVSFEMMNFERVPLPALASSVQSAGIGYQRRRYTSTNAQLCEVEDISTTKDLVLQTDYAGNGTFGTTWKPQDYQVEPVNGIKQGQAGWAITKLRAVRSLYFPAYGSVSFAVPYTQALIEVTARWGWPSIPTMIEQATIYQAEYMFKAGDVPLGATTFGESGVISLKSRPLHPVTATLIEPFQHETVLVG